MPPVGAASLGECSRPLHERDALALDRPCDERVRALVHRTERRESFAELRVVVTVARADVPAERAQLLLEIAERDDLLGELVRLQLVAIDDDPERAERFVGCGLHCLPVLALLKLAVSGHHDDPAAEARGSTSPTRSRVPWRCPCRASRSSPRSPACRRRDARRGRRAGAGAAAAPAGGRRARTAPRRDPGRRVPSRRRRRRARDGRSRARRRSAPRTAGGRRCRAR